MSIDSRQDEFPCLTAERYDFLNELEADTPFSGQVSDFRCDSPTIPYTPILNRSPFLWTFPSHQVLAR
jgi:hypothetical protein